MSRNTNRYSPVLKGLSLSLIIGLTVLNTAEARPTQLPLSITYAVEPNVMILFDTSGSMGYSMTDADGNNSTRLQIGKDAMTNLIRSTEGVRFGVATFNNKPSISNFYSRAQGAYLRSDMVLSSDESDLNEMIDSIDALDDYGSTPLQDAYYDMLRYYRHMTPYFGVFPSSYPDPIQYRCQSNSIIAVTDGEPEKDWDHKSVRNCSSAPSKYKDTDNKCDVTYIDLSDDPDANWGGTSSGPSLPDWDGIDGVYPSGTTNAGSTIIDGVRPYPPYTDGTCAGNVYGSTYCRNLSRYSHSSNFVMDDMAMFASDIDFKKSGVDLAGVSFQDPKFTQNVTTHTIGFNFDSQLLRDVASVGYGNGLYASASTETGLKNALEAAVLTAVGGRGSGAGATQSSIALDENDETSVYITEYNSEQWSGELYKLTVTATNAGLEATPAWQASQEFESDAWQDNKRNIFTHDGSSSNSTFAFIPGNLGRLSNQSAYGSNPARTIEYLRGNQAYEQTATQEADRLFRSRVSPLGDMIHSRPTFVRNLNFGYTDDDYTDYVISNAKDTSGARDATLYVGGNDGMLHAFKESDGSETFAFIPRTIQGNLPELAKLEFDANHQYFVDGDMSIVDVRLDDDWSTVLVSPLGGGYKGLFMLDITDPNASHENIFQWEINEKTTNVVNGSSAPVFSKMGYMLNNPKIVRFRIPDGTGGGFHEKWVVITGNGVHSEDAADNNVIGKASIFVIDLETGELISEIVVDNGYVDQDTGGGAVPAYSRLSKGNGVTAIAAVDVSTNSYIDRLYATDLMGQLWRIDYNYDQSDNPADDNEYIQQTLEIAFNPGNVPAPIFTATGPVRANASDSSPSGSIRQPITGELTVTRAPVVADSRVGEMVFFGTGQYFDFHHILDKDNLKVQSFYAIWDKGNWDIQTDPISKANDLIEQGIVESGNERTLTNAAINYAANDLGWYVDLPTYGERIIKKPIGIFSHISFFSQVPKDPDVCIEGNSAWAMVARRDTATPLVNSGTTLPAGTRHDGLIQDPIFVETTDGNLIAPAFLFSEDSNGDTSVTVDTIIDIQKNYSRSSWKRLRF